MSDRVSKVADILLGVEQQLRLLGLWSEQEPSPEALSSGAPFCVDTLEFHHWLQYVFLAKMKVIIEHGSALPSSSQILPMAQEAFEGGGDHYAPLLRLIGEFDAIIAFK